MSKRLGTNQTITMSGSSQQSTAFGAQTFAIRLATAGQPAFFEIGASPAASASTSPVMPANTSELFTVTPGQKVAVLEAGTAGAISITELT